MPRAHCTEVQLVDHTGADEVRKKTAVTGSGAQEARRQVCSFWKSAIGEDTCVELVNGEFRDGRLAAIDSAQTMVLFASLSSISSAALCREHVILAPEDMSSLRVGGAWSVHVEAHTPPEQPGPDTVDGGTPASKAAQQAAHVQEHFWRQRYSLFSRYDEGVRMDAEGWYSVTHERVAEHIADRCRCDLLLDGFVGVGGNAIQFALTCERVIAIDNNLERLLIAKHNAKVYGVADRIDFIHGDFMQLTPRMCPDVIFLSPPWGGPNYKKQKEYDLETGMNGLNGFDILSLALAMTADVAYYLPRNTSKSQLAKLGRMQHPSLRSVMEVLRCFLNGSEKAVLALFGGLPSLPQPAGT